MERDASKKREKQKSRNNKQLHTFTLTITDDKKNGEVASLLSFYFVLFLFYILSPDAPPTHP